MKTKASTKRKPIDDEYGVPDAEMPELTDADFAHAKPNRFARHTISLDDDVAKYFHSAKEVNDALRLLIQLLNQLQPQLAIK